MEEENVGAPAPEIKEETGYNNVIKGVSWDPHNAGELIMESDESIIRETKELSQKTTNEKSFKEMLEAGEIKVGDKIAFTVFGGDKETVVTVDQAFLDLPVLEETYYKQFNYRIYEA